MPWLTCRWSCGRRSRKSLLRLVNCNKRSYKKIINPGVKCNKKRPYGNKNHTVSAIIEGLSEIKWCFLYVNLEVFDCAGDFAFHTRQVLDTADGMLCSEVNHKRMGEGCAGLGAPVS